MESLGLLLRLLLLRKWWILSRGKGKGRIGWGWRGEDRKGQDGSGPEWKGKSVMRNRTEINVELGNIGKDC